MIEYWGGPLDGQTEDDKLPWWNSKRPDLIETVTYPQALPGQPTPKENPTKHTYRRDWMFGREIYRHAGEQEWHK